MKHGSRACAVCGDRGVAHPLQFRAAMGGTSIMQNDENNSYVVGHCENNLRKDAEAHEQNWIKNL
jgi:hypothetical protein